MAQTIIFKAKGSIYQKSTVSITLFDKVDNDRPYTVQIVTHSYNNKLKEYLISNVSTKYFYNFEDAFESYIDNLQCKITLGYSFHDFQSKPKNLSL